WITAGTTSLAPQDSGMWKFGTANAPSQIANVYDGARRTWNVLATSQAMLNTFTNLEIRAFNNSCPSSCTEPPNNRIQLDPTAAFRPQERVMHEMGHLAQYKANPYTSPM